VALDAGALASGGGVVLGRSPALEAPAGVRVRPLDADVKAVGEGLSAAKVLSRQHTRLTSTSRPSGGGGGGGGAVTTVRVVDRGAVNGTTVNRTRVAAGQRMELRVGSSLGLGLPGFKVAFTLEAGACPAAAAGAAAAGTVAAGAVAGDGFPAHEELVAAGGNAMAGSTLLPKGGVLHSAPAFSGPQLGPWAFSRAWGQPGGVPMPMMSAHPLTMPVMNSTAQPGFPGWFPVT
jgi:hypothetical protein